jgi:hypothetical protein
MHHAALFNAVIAAGIEHTVNHCLWCIVPQTVGVISDA